MKESHGFLHDSNARNDERILLLRMQHGWEGYGIFFALVEMLRESGDYKLTLANIPAIAFALHVDSNKLAIILDCCFESGLLAKDEKRFWSPSLLRRMMKFEEAREAKRAGAAKRWSKAEARSAQPAKQSHPPKAPVDPKPDQPSKPIAPSADPSENSAKVNQSGCDAYAVHMHSSSIAGADAYAMDKRNTNPTETETENQTETEIGGSSRGDPPPGPEPPGPSPDLSDEFDELAAEKLAPESDEVRSDNRFVTGGRRPMQAFPEIWLTRPQLARVFREFSASGLPPDRWRGCFERCQDRLLERKDANKAPANPENWLLGWILKEALDLYRASLDVERSENWLANSNKAKR